MVEGRLVRDSAPYRYVWPAELDLMARIAGLVTEHRWCDWAGRPFGRDNDRLVGVYRVPGQARQGATAFCPGGTTP